VTGMVTIGLVSHWLWITDPFISTGTVAYYGGDHLSYTP